MIIVLKPGVSKAQADEILQQIEKQGCKPLYMPGSERVVLGALGDERVLNTLHLESYAQVESVTPILTPYKLVSRELHPHDTVVKIGDVAMGGDRPLAIIAGPCAVESYEQLSTTAVAVKREGATLLRGGAFKPRTSPYSFQGLGLAGLELLARVSREVNLPAVTEAMEVVDVLPVSRHAAAVQIGARNMQNFRLLTAVGQSQTPVILKRGMAATLQDLLLAAEYIVKEGNPNVVLCERGIKTFETATRNTLDLSAVPYLKSRSHLPVIVDPSHGTGLRELITPMALAAAACGADGLIIEVHCDPAHALSDGQQALDPAAFAALMRRLRPVVEATGRTW